MQQVPWLSVLIRGESSKFSGEVKVSWNCTSRLCVGSSGGWWNCFQPQPSDKCKTWFPAGISYSIPQWAGDIMLKCNLGMKSLRDPPSCLPNNFFSQTFHFYIIFSVGLSVLFWPTDSSADTHSIPSFFFPFKRFIKFTYSKIDFVLVLVSINTCRWV